MPLTLGITIGERITQAERLPRHGSIEFMSKINAIKKVLVGFANAQMINWRIIPYNNTFLTALPETSTTITLSDELIKTYAEYIRQRSNSGDVSIDEADMYAKILEADDELTKAEMEQNMPEMNPDTEEEGNNE